MYFNGCSSSGNISKTFIIEPLSTTGGTPVISACTEIFTNKVISCSGNTEILLTQGATVLNTDLVPTTDGTVSVGTSTMRFRELNSLSGSTTLWSATTKIITPTLDLGTDTLSNPRKITADNSIIQNDCLLGGTY